jgi:hypothetical protein
MTVVLTCVLQSYSLNVLSLLPLPIQKRYQTQHKLKSYTKNQLSFNFNFNLVYLKWVKKRSDHFDSKSLIIYVL